MVSKPIIVWFRQDLRREDNPALHAAYEQGVHVIPVYILDDVNSGDYKMGGASRWWLHQSLNKLNDSLSGHLSVFAGDAADIIPKIAKSAGAQAVYWNRCYEPWRTERDKTIKQTLKDDGLDVKSFNGSLLWEPWDTHKDDDTPYKVFTPFYKKGCLANNGEPPHPISAPERLTYGDAPKGAVSIDDLGLMPSIKWYDTMDKEWTPGEDGAMQRLEDFLDQGLRGYKEGRNFPDKLNVSRLSPHLHYGEISPRTVWHKARQVMIAEHAETDGETFCSELGWREFSNNLLYHFPTLPEEPLQEKFNNFEWHKNDEALERWQKGMTGYPIVDAGMRELWATGYMHNRVRMIVGSFLVKDLLLHWKHGERWFWDTLVDADLANNSASWQWIAGCGADAAPYFRIFNPVSQGQKFDPEGNYVRRWVPEIASLPDKYLHAPWETDHDCDYPDPIVDHKQAREEALALFKAISG
ncbi:MAG TPA: deoxyribodipyrimidine photo-lyase [Micavibrio sp.]|nr:deoxyribodipyrimidine photo-lyase [Micavibrio sp.]HIL28887.1 deoxyribodipyrimidine photo-lyase [Micavibrio sp.]